MGQSRRDFLKSTAAFGAGILLPGLWNGQRVRAQTALPGLPLSDPASQPKFVNQAPNALDPSFLYKDFSQNGKLPKRPNFRIQMRKTTQWTGLVNPVDGTQLNTELWGYGDRKVTWPGQTIQVMSSLGNTGADNKTTVEWINRIGGDKHLLPVDENLHWCFSLHGASSANGFDYRQFSIAADGIPAIPHLHGGHTDYWSDGNPEFFFTRNNRVVGPQWDFVNGGFTNRFEYDNDVKAGNLWYHDHALGITRLNVYAGLAGFYFVRDEFDTGEADNPLGLPAFPYELAYAIQDRMFTNTGALFYSAFPGDPFYDDFITGEGAVLPPDLFPAGGPTALAEFFGDHMVVNGMIWPKTDVAPRSYRLRLLNGTDSRFMVLRFRQAGTPAATDLTGAGAPIPFHVVGSDQGLASQATTTDTLVFEPGSRYDIVFNFGGRQGQRIIMENLGSDAPFGGGVLTALRDDPNDLFPDSQTDRVMAFDVAAGNDGPFFDPGAYNTSISPGGQHSAAAFQGVPATEPPLVRKVGLFEGKDEFGRLQPLLGTVHEEGPNQYGSQATPLTWFQPTTESPALGSTEEWHIYNFTGDAHPVHLHLVHFEVLGRNILTFVEDGVQPIEQHNSAQTNLFGEAAAFKNVQVGGPAAPNPDTNNPNLGYVENAPKDMVTALPGQVTRIRATFDKPGRYVWHCHILSHEDHEMMRVLEVRATV